MADKKLQDLVRSGKKEIDDKQAVTDQMYKRLWCWTVYAECEIEEKKEDELFNKKRNWGTCKKRRLATKAIFLKNAKRLLSPCRIRYITQCRR